MRVALLQARGTPGDVQENLEAVRRAAGDAAAAGAGLLVTPEAFLTGYDIGDVLRDLAEPPDGPGISAVSEAAAASGVAIACGWVERDGDAIRNSATLFDRAGRAVLTHRKAHLYGPVDAGTFLAGSELGVVDLDGVCVGLLVCFDVEFPEAVRALALAGAQLVAVPTSLMAPYDVVARTIVPARAAENQLFVAYANRAGRETTLEYVGQSCVAGPDGAVVAIADRDGETLLIADVDLSAIDRAREQYSYLRERRPDIYGAVSG